MATGPGLSLWLAEGIEGRKQFITQLRLCFSLLSLGQPKLSLQKDEKEGERETKQFQYEVHNIKYTLSVLAFRALCK